jgi:hypothetical protein
MTELLLDHTYLIRYGSNTDMLNSVTVLMITGKAYHLRYNTGLNSSSSWMQKDYFDRNYSIIEDISDFIAPKPDDLKFEITYKVVEPFTFTPYFMVEETCPVCGGSKQVHDEHTTSTYKTCPACNGSGKASKKVEIFFE